MTNQTHGRKAPAGMPHQPPRPDQNALRGKPVQPNTLPEQQPLTDEEMTERKPSLIGRILRRIALAVMLVLALVFAYIFLLLGEPDEEAKYAVPPVEETITMPMSALDMPGETDVQKLADSFGQPVLALAFAYVFLLLGEPDDEAKYMEKVPEENIAIPMSALDMPGESDVQKLADSFGQPVLSLSQMLPMYKSRIFDTAFEGEYARCLTITYTFDDGQQLLVESIRPTSAVSLLKQQDYTLDASALYSMGGLNAARMHNDTQICVFAQSATAVYAVTCPVSHEEELSTLLRFTTLTEPAQQN